MKLRKMFFSIVSTFLSLLLLIFSVYAWSTLNSNVTVDEIVLKASELKINYVLEVKKNKQEFINIETRSEFIQLFTNAIPADTFTIRLTIINASNRDTTLNIMLTNIISESNDSAFDMRDVFYIEKGLVRINREDYYLQVNSTETKVVHDQELNLYNFNNLISDNYLYLVRNYKLTVNEPLTVEFTIVYDQNTSRIEYQGGKLNIGSIYIYNN